MLKTERNMFIILSYSSTTQIKYFLNLIFGEWIVLIYSFHNWHVHDVTGIYSLFIKKKVYN